VERLLRGLSQPFNTNSADLAGDGGAKP
jgi:hypothetical protein